MRKVLLFKKNVISLLLFLSLIFSFNIKAEAKMGTYIDDVKYAIEFSDEFSINRIIYVKNGKIANVNNLLYNAIVNDQMSYADAVYQINELISQYGIDTTVTKYDGLDTGAIRNLEDTMECASKVFDAEYYISKYPEIAQITTDPDELLYFYANYGIYEDRDASATFNYSAYKLCNGDINDSWQKAMIAQQNIPYEKCPMKLCREAYIINHYFQQGQYENRTSTVEQALDKGIRVRQRWNGDDGMSLNQDQNDRDDAELRALFHR